MGDALFVAEVDAVDELLKVVSRDVFRCAALSDPFEQFAASHELHDDVELGIRCEDLNHAHDMAMLETAHDVNLTAHLRREILRAYLGLVHDLDGNAYIGTSIDSNLDPSRAQHDAMSNGLETVVT